MSDNRLTDLEELTAHLARTVDELNEVGTRQAGEIDRLTHRVAMLMNRAAEAELAESGTVPLADQKPPHW
jgi:SlyX protein